MKQISVTFSLRKQGTISVIHFFQFPFLINSKIFSKGKVQLHQAVFIESFHESKENKLEITSNETLEVCIINETLKVSIIILCNTMNM